MHFLEYGLVPNRWQAITWSNADLVHWRIYAALGEMSQCLSSSHLILSHHIKWWSFVVLLDGQISVNNESIHFIHTIWWHRTGSTLAQVMACCLMAPSHYPNQCWLIIIHMYFLFRLTHWPLGDLDAILKLQSSILFYWLVSSHHLMIDNALRWMPRNFTDDKSTFVQVMACCRTAPSHYLSQCWPRSPYGITRPWWIKVLFVSHSLGLSMRSNNNHLCSMPPEIPGPSIAEIITKIKYLKFHSNFPGANELIDII